jgi:peroxiredoxin
MKNFLIILIVMCSTGIGIQAQTTYKINDQIQDFSLLNIDNNMLSLSDYSNQKGVIVIFTCNTCPYANANDQRIIELDKKFKPLGFPVLAINPNDPARVPGDAFEKMQEAAREKGYPFPYVFDETQEIARKFGATRTPEVFLLIVENGKFKLVYTGAIDDSPLDEDDTQIKYLENAIQTVKNAELPDPASTKSIGCTIKWKL